MLFLVLIEVLEGFNRNLPQLFGYAPVDTINSPKMTPISNRIFIFGKQKKVSWPEIQRIWRLMSDRDSFCCQNLDDGNGSAPLLALPFVFGIIFEYPWFITSDQTTEKISVILTLSRRSRHILPIVFLFGWEVSWHLLCTDIYHPQILSQNPTKDKAIQIKLTALHN